MNQSQNSFMCSIAMRRCWSSDPLMLLSVDKCLIDNKVVERCRELWGLNLLIRKLEALKQALT